MDPADEQIILAQKELRAGRHDSALHHCHLALWQRPLDGEVFAILHQIVREQSKAGRHEEMARTLRLATQSFPESPEMHFNLGSALFRPRRLGRRDDSSGERRRPRRRIVAARMTRFGPN